MTDDEISEFVGKHINVLFETGYCADLVIIKFKDGRAGCITLSAERKEETPFVADGDAIERITLLDWGEPIPGGAGGES